MNGQLSSQPLAELVREVSIGRLSGTMRLERQRVKAVVYFEAGRVVMAASNVRHLRLSEYLQKRNLISPQYLEGRANFSDTVLAELLVRDGVVRQQSINEVMTAIVADVLRLVLLWPDGAWEFDGKTRLADSLRVSIATEPLLLEAARRMDLKFVASRFPDPSETITPVTNKSELQSLHPTEAFVLTRIDGPLALSEVVSLSGLRDPDALRVIYGLLLSHRLERREWQSNLSSLASAAKVTSETAGSEVEPARSDEEDLAVFLSRIDAATTHYEVLDISNAASVEEIKRGYYTLARRYHPDRFHAKEVHDRVESAFARITQAYETLNNITHRNTYDAKLAAQERTKQLAQSAPRGAKTEGQEDPSAETRSDEYAEQRFREGYAALKQGQPNIAVTHLAAAAQAAPSEPRYRAYYGQALTLQGKSTRLAEMELQAAVKLDPGNASYRIMLANLYYQLEFLKRAQAEVERALQIDPQNAAAQTLLRKLE